MAGKSTLLRAIGLNVVLAQCGAPVCCSSLTLSPLAVGASITVQDSLQSGLSRFYAEIQRLKQITDLAGRPQPTLFLLDELLSGTNSHDRRVGTEALLRSLLARNAIGLITTHDLALTEIAGVLDRARHQHALRRPLQRRRAALRLQAHRGHRRQHQRAATDALDWAGSVGRQLETSYRGAGVAASASAYAVTAITAAFSPSSRGFTLSKVSAAVW